MQTIATFYNTESVYVFQALLLTSLIQGIEFRSLGFQLETWQKAHLDVI